MSIYVSFDDLHLLTPGEPIAYECRYGSCVGVVADVEAGA